MADEIKIKHQPDEANVFATVRNKAGQVAIVLTGVFETWVDGNVGTYDIPATEKGGGGMFYANFPATIAAGDYDIEGFQGATDGTADSLGSESFSWDGTAETAVASPLIAPAGYVGDYKLLETVYFTFSTNKTLSNSGNSLRVFKNNETSPLGTAQATLDIDIGSESNVHSVSIVLGQANYDKETDYNVVLSGATIGGETVTAIVGTFSIENRWQAPKHRHIAP